ncbi:hypothetical protein P9X10_00875 [Bacillus cereus]|nr:hypothetical protein [Bacillus cereus]
MSRIKLDLPLDDTSKVKETWDLDKKVGKVYEIKKKLEGKYEDVFLVSIIDEIPIWQFRGSEYVVLDMVEDKLFMFELTLEQELAIRVSKGIDDIVESLNMLYDVEEVLTRGIDGLISIFTSKDKGDLIENLYHEDDYESRFTKLATQFEKKDKEVVLSVIKPIIEDFKNEVKKRMHDKKYNNISEVTDSLGKISLFLVKITPNIVEETKEYMKSVIQELFKLEEFNESMYVTNAMCLFLKKVDIYLGVKDSKYAYYNSIISDPLY